MISSESNEEIKNVIESLKQKYQQITVNEGNQHTYLGMFFDFSNKNKVTINMNNYIEKLLNDHKITRGCDNPVLQEIKDSPLLDQNKQKFIQSGVAKLLYLATRTKPDILYPVNKLCSRVNKYTEQDQKQFYKILEYLYNNRNTGITLESNDNESNIEAYIDASYGTNTDRKSQTGLYITYGKGPIICKSTKQNIVAKSSTEAELIACSDSISIIYSIKNIMEFLNMKVDRIIIHQDNQSTIKLINNKHPTTQRSKHIDIRYFFLRDRNENEFKIKYCPTEDMIADLLTKYINNHQFKKLRNLLINNQS